MVFRLTILSLKAEKAGADKRRFWPDSPDDTYIKIDNEEVWGDQEFKSGQLFEVNHTELFSDQIMIELFDRDPGSDDGMGRVIVDGDVLAPNSGQRTEFRFGPSDGLRGSGSEYSMTVLVENFGENPPPLNLDM